MTSQEELLAQFLARHPELTENELCEALARYYIKLDAFLDKTGTSLEHAEVKVFGPREELAELSAYLRSLRKNLHPVPTLENVAEKMRWSKAKQLRLEHGLISVSPSDLGRLLAFYNVSEEDKARWVEVARRTYKGN